MINTYRKYFDGNIYNISVTYHEIISRKHVESIIKTKNFKEAKFHFLWFNSSGFIHKGLDLLIDYFSKQDVFHLHICGDLSSEIKFYKYYYNLLYNHKKIHTHGFINLDSKKFIDILNICAFTILPSCSEGEPSSIINLMANGILPIVNEDAGIEKEDYVIQIKKLDLKSLHDSINFASNLKDEVI